MRTLLLSVVALAAAGPAVAQQPPTDTIPTAEAKPGDANRGAELMAADGCYQCHGYVGQGSIRTGPSLAPNVIPFAAFMAQLRKPMDRMPVYTAVVLSDADAANIYAYLKSIPPPPKPADIALLQQ